MSRVLIAMTDLSRSLGVPADLLRRLERAGLVVPIAKDDNGEQWVDAGARRQVERVQSLIAAGYAERDIALVIGRAERTDGSSRLESIIGAEELLTKARIERGTLDRWIAQGAIPGWAVEESGAPLFLRRHVVLARALRALELLGLGELVGTWSALARGEPGAAGRELGRELSAELTTRLDDAEHALQTLRKLLPRLVGSRLRRRRSRLLARRRSRQ